MSEPSTGGMIANMLGLGPIMQAFNSPDFQAQINALVGAIAQTAETTRRVEIKLDLLMSIYSGNRPEIAAALARVDAPRTGPNTPPGGVAHDGGGGTPQAPGGGRDRVAGSLGSATATDVYSLVAKLP